MNKTLMSTFIISLLVGLIVPLSFFVKQTDAALLLRSGGLDMCLKGDFCMYGHKKYGGYLYKPSSPYVYNTCQYVGDSFNDKTSSLFNNSSYYVYVYQHYNCKGNGYLIVPGRQIDKLADDGSNDSISAYKIIYHKPRQQIPE